MSSRLNLSANNLGVNFIGVNFIEAEPVVRRPPSIVR